MRQVDVTEISSRTCFFFSVIFRQAIGQDIGKCSRITFTNGGQQCQRTMMSNLTSNSSISCRFEGSFVTLPTRQFLPLIVRLGWIVKESGEEWGGGVG